MGGGIIFSPSTVAKSRGVRGTFEATSMEEKFAAWSPSGSPSECWNWSGPISSRGYGSFRAGGKHYYAHRIALERVSLATDPALFCCHRCDNPLCVNPEHLFWGDAADNNRDRAVKGRTVTQFVKGSAHPSFGRFGEAHCASRLSDSEVAAIRRRVNGGESQSAVARSLGLHSSYVSRIARNLVRQEV